MVVVAIATEIINAGMIWRRLFAFIQLFQTLGSLESCGMRGEHELAARIPAR
jgi:hypothetical protein